MSVTGLAGMYNIKQLLPDLHPPEDVFAGIPATFRISVRNTKRILPSFLVRLECDIGQATVFPVILQNSTNQSSAIVTFNKRGQVHPGRITVSSPYPVGFFTRYWSFEIDSMVTVFPRPIATLAGGSGEESSATGIALRPERGLSGELERISLYSGTEPLRMIHWKLSARSHDLLVKGFGRSVVTPLMIDLDTLPGELVEERLSRAAWLVQRWIRERPVGLLLAGRVLQAGMGKQHRLMLLKELALYGSD